MADEQIVANEQVQEPVIVSPFSTESWKSEPTIPKSVEAEVIIPAVVEEKKEEVKPEIYAEKPAEIVPQETLKPIEFANDESKKAYELLLAGKIDEVRDILNEQKKLSEVDKLAPAEIIKLNLQYQHKDFSPTEIADLFNEQYEIPEAPKQGVSELDEEFEERVNKHEKEVKKIEARIARDSKPAASELLKLQKEIVLPNMVSNQPEIIAPTQEELEADKKKGELFIQNLNDGLSKFKGYDATFKDEEVELSVAYKMTNDEKTELQPIIALSKSDAGAFLTKIGWLDADGNINTSKLIEDLPLVLNKQKVIQQLVSETGNKRYEASAKAIKNIDYSGVKNTGGDTGDTPQQKEHKMVTHFFSQ